MKLLIAYDGSQYSESAIDDLAHGGLPPVGEALIITVAEIWMRPPAVEPSNGDDTESYIEEALKRHSEKGKKLLSEAQMMVSHAISRVKAMLPGWKVEGCATYGSAAWEIICKADEFEPDLIVLGSHGQSQLSRLVLGSISQKVLSEAYCSVRISRGRVEVEPSADRILLGLDGSVGAEAAINEVASRTWPAGSVVKIVAATDTIVPTSIGRFIPPVSDWAEEELKSDYKWLSALAMRAEKKLRDAGLRVEICVLEGNPKDVLVREAENWHADCIFMGANCSGSRLERFLLGSTSSAITSRAQCSVEVVRKVKAAAPVTAPSKGASPKAMDRKATV